MKRHSVNTNLTLVYQATYLNLPIQLNKAPFALEYLNKLFEVMMAVLNEYPRVFAFRVDLRFPALIDAMDYQSKNEVMTRFIRSFKAKIGHNRCMAKRLNPHAHESTVRDVWAREQDQSSNPHYHVVFFLNQDAFCTIGKYELDRDNIFNRLCEAWASALGLPVEAVSGLVEIPSNPSYYLHRDKPENLAEFFYRASYLCKAATKVFGDGTHGFGCSRG